MRTLQRQVQDAIDQLVDAGEERGLQVAVYRHGELVVDAVAGVADAATGRPVASDTLFYTYSTGKAMTATVAHVLAEQGVLDYDTPIARLWPEFGAHGKDTATLRHVLTHTVGVPAVPADTTPEDLCDWDKMCARIAAAEPWWPPGTKTGYHAYPFGYIIGEVVRRATGERISQVLRERVAAPLGVPDELFFGAPAAALGRIARLEDAPGGAEMLASMPDDSPFFATAPKVVTPTAELGNRPDILQADIPAGGKMTARAIARMYAALLGEVDGVRLVSPARLREATAVAVAGDDQVFGFPVRRGLGFEISAPSSPEATPTEFGYGGVGGSNAWADTATGTAFALAKNRLAADFATSDRLGAMVREAVAGGDGQSA
jgi:CubicO group peptidase (beta-lactamase class C family)